MDGIPAFFIRLLRREYGAEAERILLGYETERPVTLRINTLKSDRARVSAALSAAEIECGGVPWYPDALIVKNVREDALRALPEYERGEIYLQSLSSMLPPLILNAEAGERVLDMAAAPGGKTAQIAALAGGQALITACEKDKIRFQRLKYNAEKQGIPKLQLLLTDAAKLDDFFRFDKILLDAPCSGSGTIVRGKPVRITEQLIGACVREQERLLRKGMRLLRRGGRLVYSTCSVLREENEALLERVLSETGGKLCPIDASRLEGVPLLSAGETLTVCPDRLYEGFFLALIEKKETGGSGER